MADAMTRAGRSAPALPTRPEKDVRTDPSSGAEPSEGSVRPPPPLRSVIPRADLTPTRDAGVESIPGVLANYMPSALSDAGARVAKAFGHRPEERQANRSQRRSGTQQLAQALLFADEEAGQPRQESKGFDAIDRSFHANRLLALLRPERLVETMRPYAKLHLKIYSGRNLIPADIIGTSDPYVQVYVDDVLKCSSHHQKMTLNPLWNWPVELDIWTPHTQVQLRVMDKDRWSNDDAIGFVEFSVADLKPGQPTSGQFELRRKERLLGFASDRIRQHMKCRDADAPQESVAQSPAESQASPVKSSNLPALPSRVAKAGRSLCCKGMPESDDEDDHDEPSSPQTTTSSPPSKHESSESPSSHWQKLKQGRANWAHEQGLPTKAVKRPKRQDAGGLNVSLHLEPCFTPFDDWDEWFAFCVPRPPEKYYDAPQTFLQPQGLYDIVNRLRIQLLERALQRLLSVLTYVLTWQSWQLSGGLLLWWWASCFYKQLFWPIFPLWLASLLYMLRTPSWRRAIMSHPSWTPFSQQGFELVAKHRDSKKMALWLERVIQSLGGRVNDQMELEKFASVAFWKGRPLFPYSDTPGMDASLLARLRGSSWISWDTSRVPACPQGHKLLYMDPAKAAEDVGWCCMKVGGCPHTISADETTLKPLESGFHMGRFFCKKCDFTLCEDCAIVYGTKPSHFLPVPLYFFPDSIEHLVNRAEGSLESLRTATNFMLHALLHLFDSTEAASNVAKNIYITCISISAGLFLAEDYFAWALHILIRMCWLLLGTFVMALNMPILNRCAACVFAHFQYEEFRRRRALGGCKKFWAFFRPDEHSR